MEMKNNMQIRQFLRQLCALNVSSPSIYYTQLYAPTGPNATFIVIVRSYIQGQIDLPVIYLTLICDTLPITAPLQFIITPFAALTYKLHYIICHLTN